MTSRRRYTASVAVNGTRIRRLRKEAGLGTRDLAEKVGVTQSHIINLELGYKRRVSAGTFGKLCDALEIPRAERSTLYGDEELDDAERAAVVA